MSKRTKAGRRASFQNHCCAMHGTIAHARRFRVASTPVKGVRATITSAFALYVTPGGPR